MKNKFQLGVSVEDKITGFSGTITGVTYYLDGRIEYCVQPTINDRGETRESKWIPECYLSEKVLNNTPLGFSVDASLERKGV